MTIKKESSDKFYQKISALAQKGKFPLKAMFELTYKCNFKCIHCYIAADKRKRELNTSQVKQVLDQLRDAGCFHIGLTGGEPLLREDIFEIFDYAKREGFRISLLTNGYLVDKEAAKRITSLGTSLNRVDVSVLGARERTFEKITGKKGSFKKVMEAIRLLKAEGVDVQIKATLMEPNKGEFLRIRELADKFDTMFRYGPTVNKKVDGNEGPLRYRVEPEEALRIKKELSRSRKVIDEQELEESGLQAGRGFEVSGRELKSLGRKRLFRCGAGQTEVSISPYGEMNLCLEIHYPEYNILKGSFKEGWERIKNIVKKMELKPSDEYECKDCLLAPFCHWCPARNWFSPGDFAKCSRHEKETALIAAKDSPWWSKLSQLKQIKNIEKAVNVHKRKGV